MFLGIVVSADVYSISRTLSPWIGRSILSSFFASLLLLMMPFLYYCSSCAAALFPSSCSYAVPSAHHQKDDVRAASLSRRDVLPILVLLLLSPSLLAFLPFRRMHIQVGLEDGYGLEWDAALREAAIEAQ